MSQILGLNKENFYTLLFVILLVILGVVSFHYYTYVSAYDNLSAGAGFGITLFPSRQKPKQEGFY